MQENTLDGERIAHELAEAERARQLAEAAQPALFTSNKTTMKNHPYRLRAGDRVSYAGQHCHVVRVNDCAAVVAVTKPAREFTTLFGVHVRNLKFPSLTVDCPCRNTNG
jgi:hypothetical protein